MAEPTKQDLADLARTVALIADATARYIEGTMSKNDAVSNLHNLNHSAAVVMRKFS